MPNIDTIIDGRDTVSTAGTAVQLGAQACKFVIIMAETDNTGLIAVGGSTVVAAEGSQRGKILYTGQTEKFEVDNMDQLYIDGTVNGEGITWIAFL